MNGIDKITDRIAVDAQQECQKILDRGKQQSSEITAGYQALAESDYQKTVAKGKTDAAERIERLGSVAQLDARKLRLAAKQEMLDKAFDLALEKLLALPEGDYVALLARLAAQGCDTGREALVLSTKDRPLYGKKVVVAANELLTKAGKTAELTLSEESRDFRGGLYIQDGKVENNCTFPTIVRMLKEQMSVEVAGILFE